ncbi:MAG: HpcH/HpaI aldolase/citrate lyase family protein [Blastocatellia bacterium]
MIARSYLFAPGNNQKLLAKVFDAGADAVVLDLEDAVPLNQKLEARRMIADALSRPLAGKAPAYVRINAVSTDLWQDDIAAAVAPGLRGIRLAKAESAEEVRRASEALALAEGKAGIPVGALRIVPTIESARGVIAAFEIASAPRVESLSFGAADFIRDIGATVDGDESQTLYARSHLVAASRAAGIQPPVASVFTNLKDLEGLRRTTQQAAHLGFFGRSCIHPSQVAVVNEVFTPTQEAIAEAEAVVRAFDEAVASGAGVATLANGQFIDAPIVARAKAVLTLAASLR